MQSVNLQLTQTGIEELCLKIGTNCYHWSKIRSINLFLMVCIIPLVRRKNIVNAREVNLKLISILAPIKKSAFVSRWLISSYGDGDLTNSRLKSNSLDCRTEQMEINTAVSTSFKY